jgi:hypothetical protein
VISHRADIFNKIKTLRAVWGFSDVRSIKKNYCQSTDIMSTTDLRVSSNISEMCGSDCIKIKNGKVWVIILAEKNNTSQNRQVYQILDTGGEPVYVGISRGFNTTTGDFMVQVNVDDSKAPLWAVDPTQYTITLKEPRMIILRKEEMQ